MEMRTHPRNPQGEVDSLFAEYQKKIVLDYDKLRLVAGGYQALGRKVVVTIGSWDGLHIGQVRYIIRARQSGDMLITAFDTDRAIKLYKGEHRPIVPECERAEMLTYLAENNYVTAVDDVDEEGRWQYGLIRAVRPDIFVAVEDSYPPEQIADIRQYCSEVIVLPRQAETSTSAQIHKMVTGYFLPAFQEVLSGIQKRKPVPPRSDSSVHSSAT